MSSLKPDYLKPEIHSALLKQLQFISEQAHIPADYIKHVGAKEYCTESEMLWLRNAKKTIRDSGSGMVLNGPQNHSVTIKLLAMGATLTRNFIDARFYTLSSLIDILESKYEDDPECTVLLIPDLCIKSYDIPKRQIHKLSGLLLNRFVAKKPTISYVDSLTTVSLKYGDNFAEDLRSSNAFFNCSDISIA